MVDAGYNIRVFNPEELQQVMNINTACLPENYSTFFYRDLYQKYPETFLVAEVNGEIQGYIMCRIEKGWSKLGKLTPARLCHVVSIAVMENYRRRGIGKELVIKAMMRGRELYNSSEGYLEVRVSNDAAVGLYENLDFDKVKRNYGYYMDGEDAWVMAINLNKF
ncbi:MAG: GNAT family N-acetyltransferase [Candidatus Bathyarchaeota archaeon]|nr:GNAT family N-acetyltransferase [Candidatus Bathyarchaeota archaeon]